MKFNLKLLLFIVVFSSFFISFSQNNNTDFEKAVKLYEEKKYYQALNLFQSVIKKYPENSRTTAAIIFKGKTFLALNKINDAKTTAVDFLNKYPSSSYIEEARLLLAEIYLNEKDYLKSINQLLSIIQDSDSLIYKSEALSSAGDLALQYLTAADLKSLYNSYKNKDVKSFLLFLTAKVQIVKNQFQDALVTLNELIKLYPGSKFINEAELLKTQISQGEIISESNETNICVMLPLSGLNSSEALTASKEILEGIKFALDEFNKGREDKIGLIIKDTENDRDKIISIKNEIVSDPSVKMVIGPVFSSEVEVALEEFKATDISIISPTATDNDLTLMNENFFQANPNFVIRAKAMAQHIFYVENKRSMAVLNSIDGYSPLLAAEFVKEFERLGGKIVKKYTYKSENLSSGIRIDSTELIHAEGIYIPLSDKIDAPLILSQLVQNNINLSLYGNQDWFLAKGFETSPELSNKMIFESDYFIEYNNSDYQNFSKNFLARTRVDANRNVLYGYDTAKYILTILRNISRDRKNIKTKMESGITVKGFHNNISFNDDHVNIYINIVRYNEGYFELVDKFKVTK
ncbi:MAG: penicillin-binding protein activator [Ignavibacteria bacterium]|nr:penicillin-binding protein activator [Ignavibacteria bacterium]